MITGGGWRERRCWFPAHLEGRGMDTDERGEGWSAEHRADDSRHRRRRPDDPRRDPGDGADMPVAALLQARPQGPLLAWLAPVAGPESRNDGGPIRRRRRAARSNAGGASVPRFTEDDAQHDQRRNHGGDSARACRHPPHRLSPVGPRSAGGAGCAPILLAKDGSVKSRGAGRWTVWKTWRRTRVRR